jgi:nitrogenase molybdenum-iron protein alpha/beta subunit
MDRGEEDHLANLRELRRMLEALSLETAPIWLSGMPYDTLGEIRDAGVIVSLPHARQAARAIADQTGARLVEAGLPFGLKGTTDWLRVVAAATGKEEQAEAFIAEELGGAARKIEWLLPSGFVGRRFLPVIDPHLISGFLDLIGELGGEVPRAYTTGEAEGLPPDVRRLDLSRLGDDLQALHREQELDLALCNAFLLGVFQHLGIGFLEFGFPSHTEHCLHSRPFLGYQGCLSLVERMYNRMQLFRLLQQ